MEDRKAFERLAYEYQNEALSIYADNRMSEAISLIRNAIHLFQKIGNEEAQAVALNFEGVLYSAMGNETSALDSYLQGLEIAIEKQYSYIAVRLYNNIGTRYQELGTNSKAIEYYRRAEMELAHPQCKRNVSYPNWALITYLNMCIAFTANGDYDLAQFYLDKTKGWFTEDNRKDYEFTVLITESRLKWLMGHHDEVRKNIDLLREGGLSSVSTTDYIPEMRELCGLFEMMEEYDCWRKLVYAFEEYAKKQESLYYIITAHEMKMGYYKAVGDNEKYAQLCIEYVELDNKRKLENMKERSEAIDMKIELQEKEQARKRAEQKSNTDRLTKLGNRYKMEADCGEMIEDCRMFNQSIVIGIIDIDCFKEVNDTYGHICGDECLQKVADILASTLDDAGMAYRYGGDEFVILMSGCNVDIVRQFAQMVSKSVEACSIENINSTVKPILTLSQGYAIFNQLRKNDNFETLLKEADDTLYFVKAHGKDGYKISDNERI